MSVAIQGTCTMTVHEPSCQIHSCSVQVTLTLQDVAVAAAGLSWAGGNASQQTTSGELLSQVAVQLAALGALLQLALDVVAGLCRRQQYTAY